MTETEQYEYLEYQFPAALNIELDGDIWSVYTDRLVQFILIDGTLREIITLNTK